MPAPRGIPQIEVTFDLDANGILNVGAKDKGTGKEQKITITSSKKMPKEEVEKAIKEAERFAEEDKKRKEKVEIINQSDTLIYTTEKTLVEQSDKISSDERDKVQKAVNELKEAVKGGEVGTIKSKIEALTKEMYQISTRIYSEASKQGAQSPDGQQGQQAGGQAQQEPGQQPSEQGDYVDADYKIVDDDEKK
jgi:molecular chaperone DnaK